MSDNARIFGATALHAVLAEFSRGGGLHVARYHDTVAMADEIVRLRAAIDRVRALHASVEIGFGPICDECSSASDGWIVPYPCPTLRALDGEGA
jgi:hypothetical protein